MKKSFRHYLSLDIEANGFRLGPKDAEDTAKNITLIFCSSKTGWLSLPKPIHINELCRLYKETCPDMEIHFPGVIDKVFHPEIITKLGCPVYDAGMVHFD